MVYVVSYDTHIVPDFSVKAIDDAGDCVRLIRSTISHLYTKHYIS